MRRGARIAIAATALVVLAGGVAGSVWWWYDSHRWAESVPYLSFAYGEPIAPGAQGVSGLVLHAHNDTRQAKDEGFIVHVANVGDQPVRFNTRPFRQAKGVGGWAEDTEGKRHPLVVEAVYPRGRYYIANAQPLPEDNVPLCEADIIPLKPGARFSISITFHATDDPRYRNHRAKSEVTRALGPHYPLKNYTLTFSYAREDDAPEDVWQGTLTSNPLRCDQNPPPVRTRFRRAGLPQDLFQTLYDRMRHYSRRDTGRRLLIFQHFCLLDQYGILRPGQFDQVLDWAVVDDAPLMRLEGVRYPRTWKNLLLDADPDVRQRALLNAAKRDVYPRRGEITEIVAAIYLSGDAGDRLLAIEAFRRHAYSGNQYSRLRWDIPTKALDDPDETVRERARELFAHSTPLVTVPF